MPEPLSSLSAIRMFSVEFNALTRAYEALRPEEDRGPLLLRARSALDEAKALRIDQLVTVGATLVAKLLNDSHRHDEAIRVVTDHPPPISLRNSPTSISLAAQRVRALVERARLGPANDCRKLWKEIDSEASALIASVEESIAKVSAPELFNTYRRFSIDLNSAAVEARLALGDLAGALAGIEQVKCRFFHRLFNRHEDDDEYGHRAELQKVVNDIRSLEAANKNVPETLRARRRDLWSTLAVRRFKEHSTTFAGFDASEFQAKLPARTAALCWFWLDKVKLVVAAISREKIAMCLQTMDAQQRAEIENKARAILGFRDGDVRDITRVPGGFTDVLIPRDIRAVLEGVDRLIFSPHRHLHALPLHALPWEQRRPIIRSFAISYAPNLTALCGAQRARSGRRTLFVGVPHRAAGMGGSALEGATRERDAVGALYPDSFESCFAEEATRTALDALNAEGDLARFDILHIACHGENIDSDNPMESRLLLYDADIDGLEVSEWRLDADLVILSACSAGQRPVSGRGLSELPGDELFGLQAAFFAAGTQRVLATLWPVGDGVAPFVCESFHAHLAHEPADVALQRALGEYLDFSGLAAEMMPHEWACFFLNNARMPAARKSSQ